MASDTRDQIRRSISRILPLVDELKGQLKPLSKSPLEKEVRGAVQKRDKIITHQDEIIKCKDGLIAELEKRLSVKNAEKMKEIAQPRERTFGISAKPPSTDKGTPAEKSKVSKSTAEFLALSMMDNNFLKRFGQNRLVQVASRMEEQTVKKSSVIMKQGDTGDRFYVIEEGSVGVSKDGVSQLTLGRGKVFGELALLYNAKRTATVEALMSCKLWYIERETFQRIMMAAELESQRQIVNFLKSCEMFKNFSDQAFNQLADVLEEVRFEYGDYIVRQGNTGDTFFILVKGEVKVTQKMTPQGREEEIRRLKVGQYFGEKALEGDEKRTASIIASDVNGVTCYVLDRDSYKQLVSAKLRKPSQPEPAEQDKLEKIDLKKLSIVKTLGIGGFGRVELVTIGSDKSKSYALKKMVKQHIVDTKQEQHVLSERNILRKCKNDFICKLYGSNQDDKCLYFLLEACLGGELWSLLRTKNSFNESTTRFFIACVTEALGYLHSINIVFRDLKPENLILDSNGYLKMTDFGFAKRLEKGQKTWTFCGTPEYIAPEIIQNKGHDITADLWSLGVLIYELHSGSPPFSYSDHIKTYNAILGGIQNVIFPKTFSRNTQWLIKMLCRENPRERLGAGPDGMKKEIQQHRWFIGFNFEALRNRTYPVPYDPKVKGPLDASKFDDFPALDESGYPVCTTWDRDF